MQVSKGQCYALDALCDRSRMHLYMRKSWLLFLPSILFWTGLTGCGNGLLRNRIPQPSGATVERVAPQNSPASGERIGTQSLTVAGNQRILRNDTANIEIVIPSSWTERTNLHDSAELEAADPEKQLFIIVVAEEDEALLRLGLRENSEKYRQLLISQLPIFEGQTATDVSFIGDNFASQYEIRGRINNNTPVVYLHTTVVTAKRYYQIVGWTSPEQYNFYKSELQAITDTFRETDS